MADTYNDIDGFDPLGADADSGGAFANVFITALILGEALF